MKLVEVLIATRSVTTEYKQLYGTCSPISILEKGVKTIVEKQTDQAIEITCLPWPGTMFAARLDRFKDKSNIWYSDQLNTCWSRFYIAKELVHIICGDEKNFTTNIMELMDAIINGVHVISLTEETNGIHLEILAFLGAIEILIPEHLYQELYEMSQHKTEREIAEYYKIPEQIITYRLSDNIKKIFDQFKEETR